MKHICLFIFAFITADMFINTAMAAKANGTAEELTACPRDWTQFVNPYIKMYSGACPAGYTEIQTRSSYVCNYSGYSGYSGYDYLNCFLYLDPGLDYSDDSGRYRYSGFCEYEP